MSTATDEARKESYRRCLEGCVAPAQFSFQDGYVAGRTAEPTEAEIEAVADELAAWNFDVAMNSGTTIHGASADFSSRSFELLAKRALNAARKSVAESRERES